jgi:hypothetical protein
LQDETCWLLAVDFDKKTWQKDAAAFLVACREMNVPAVLERSRSGNGGHVWIFFNRAIPATIARKLGCAILTRTMEFRHQLGLGSYDRFFPNQDTMPKGGLGNLIALPLQKIPRAVGNSVFVDSEFRPYQDQWAFLASIERMSPDTAETVVGSSKTRRSHWCQDQHYGRRRARSLGAAAVTKENRPPNTGTVSTHSSNRSRKPSVYREEWAAFGDVEPSASFSRISES